MRNRYHEDGRRRHAALWVVLMIVCALVATAGLVGAYVSYANSHHPGTQPYAEPSTAAAKPSTPTVSPAPSTTPTVVTRQCRPGWPTSFTYDALGIKASTEAVAMEHNKKFIWPDAPESKDTIAIVKNGTLNDDVTRPALPGEGYGNIIAEGHTYDDNTAVFKQDADSHAAVGQTFYFDMDNGSRCEYQVVSVWTKLAKQGSAPGSFADIAAQEEFYEPHPGHEQVLLMTCDDAMVDGHHIGELAVLATPIN